MKQEYWDLVELLVYGGIGVWLLWALGVDVDGCAVIMREVMC